MTYDIVNKNWEAFSLVARLLFHKRLVPSQEAADALREKDAQEVTALAQSMVPIEKENSGVRVEEPKKVFNPRKLELVKQAYEEFVCCFHGAHFWLQSTLNVFVRGWR